MDNHLLDIDIHSPVYPADALLWTLPAIVKESENKDHQGLSSVSTETLQQCLQPILDGLANIDAEALMHLERVSSGGTRLCNG